MYLVNLDNLLATFNEVVIYCSKKIAQIHKFKILCRLQLRYRAIRLLAILAFHKVIQKDFLTIWPEFKSKEIFKFEISDHTTLQNME